MSSQPYAGDCRGTAALRLLSALRCSVHPALDPLWSKRVPLLVEHIEGRKGLLLGRNSAGVTFSRLGNVSLDTRGVPEQGGDLPLCLVALSVLKLSKKGTNWSRGSSR